MSKRFLEAGQVVATQGLEGAVRIAPWCDSPQFLLQFDGLYSDASGQGFRRILEKRVYKTLLIVRFEGVTEVSAASALVRSVLYFDREAVALPEGSFFTQDLVGLEVADLADGRVYGTLCEVGHAPANDYYTVRRPDGREVLIPAVRAVVGRVDLALNRMLITPLKGMFDDEV